MNKTKKKLLALLTALAMVLQWVPVLAEGEPTVTVDGTSVTVTVGDVPYITVQEESREFYEEGAIKIENGRVYEWTNAHGWLTKTDENGPVDPAPYLEGYTEPEPIGVSTNAIIYAPQTVDLVDQEGQHPETIDSVELNAGDISIETNGYNTVVGIIANSSYDPVTVDV